MIKNQITQSGYIKLEKELKELEEKKRPVYVTKLQTARDKGDLSENSEYTGAKEALRFIDERIALLKYQLDNSEIITQNNPSIIDIGDMVTIESEGQTSVYTLVGEMEADISQGKLSLSSPLGKALSGHKVGENVVVETPSGKSSYKIIAVK